MVSVRERARLAGVTLLLVSVLTCSPAPRSGDRRSARPLPLREEEGRLPFDAEQSAALFVGVRSFHDVNVAEVPFAVDDAIDLAYTFALEPKATLLKPRHVILALSGAPHKRKTLEHLDALQSAGAVVVAATSVVIFASLRKQAESVGRDGIFIVSFATHGFSSEGVPFLLAESSLLGDPQSAIPTTKILDIIAASNARRSLVLLDACRERVNAATRAGGSRLASGAPLIKDMSNVDGQVVLYAAAAGKVAYDDEEARNGVFTAKVLAGLRCKAERNEHGLVTAGTLSSYVREHVRSWLQKHHPADAGSDAIQVSMDGDTSGMPLAVCTSPRQAARAAALPSPARVSIDGASLQTFGDDGRPLWSVRMDGRITKAGVADLDGDGANEVIAAAGGSLAAFSPAGERLWTADTSAPPNYDAVSGPLTIRTFTIGNLFRNGTQQIVAISADGRDVVSRLTIYDSDGRFYAGYWHPGRLQQVVIGTRTARTAPKIIATGVNRDLHSMISARGIVSTVFMLNPRQVGGEAPPYRGKLHFGSQLWYGCVLSPQKIEGVEIIDHDNDGNRDIALSTTSGRIYLDFDGKVLEARNAQFELVNPGRKSVVRRRRG
jgi:hypothetical protein